MSSRRDQVFFILSLLLFTASTFVLLLVAFKTTESIPDPWPSYKAMVAEKHADAFFGTFGDDLEKGHSKLEPRHVSLVYEALSLPHDRAVFLRLAGVMYHHPWADKAGFNQVLAGLIGEAGCFDSSESWIAELLEGLPDTSLKLEGLARHNGNSPKTSLALVKGLSFLGIDGPLARNRILGDAWLGMLDRAFSRASAYPARDRPDNRDLIPFLAYDLMLDLKPQAVDELISMSVQAGMAVLEPRILDILAMNASLAQYEAYFAADPARLRAIPLEHQQNLKLLELRIDGFIPRDLPDPVHEKIRQALELPDALAKIPALKDIWQSNGDVHALRLMLYIAFTLGQQNLVKDVLADSSLDDPWITLYRGFLEKGIDVSGKALPPGTPLLNSYALLDKARKFYGVGRLMDAFTTVQAAIAAMARAGTRLGAGKLKSYQGIHHDLLSFKARVEGLVGDSESARKDYGVIDSENPWHNQLFYSEMAPALVRNPREDY